LSAFCSLDSVPKLLVIRAGAVLDDIDASVTQDEFKKRISLLLQPQAQQQQPPPPSSSNTIPDSADSATADISQVLSNVPLIGARGTTLRESGTAPQETSETNVPIPAPTVQGNNATMQQFLTERGARLEAERKKQEEKEKEARKATAKAKREAADKQAAESSSSSSSVPHSKQDWADQQRNRNKEARTERERILKTIESDKVARKEKERQRRLAVQGESSTSATSQQPVQTDTAPGRNSSTCALQIRLFDGSSLRTRFDPSATLATSVRTYISENSQTDIPYEFRQILLPNPSRNISVGEEGESLMSLGLTPSATLVLVPIKGYTDAYTTTGGSLVSKGFNAGFGLLSGAASMLGSAVGGVMGYASGGAGDRQGPYMSGTGDQREASNVEGDRMAHSAGGGINIRTLGDQRRDKGQSTELYNGNQVSTSLKDESKCNKTDRHQTAKL
jgi:hypothetical protein